MEITQGTVDAVKGLLLALLLLAALAFAGTLDHGEEVRHEAWLAEAEARGEWVIR